MSLWTSREIADATNGTASEDFTVEGITFDSREVGPGDLFLALSGDTTDGHRFLDQAFAQGAAGAVVNQDSDHPHVRVASSNAALDAMGRASRARMLGKVIGVTGSAGKTGTKEALFAALDRMEPGTAHRSLKSYNNHVGVPLSLARMPRATRFGVFEMGMNHAGELHALTQLVRPHVAIVTTIAPAHMGFFADEAAIADAKGEIFAGLEPGGTAIIPFDSPHRDRLIDAAKPHAANIVTFGLGEGADVRVLESMRSGGGNKTFLTARIGSARELSFTLSQPGAHWLSNAMAILAAVDAVGADLEMAGLALAELSGIAGRGQRLTAAIKGGEALLIDESYNANPASMRATLQVLGQEGGRHIAVLGEMRELGVHSDALHAGLAAPIAMAGVEFAILVGAAMAPLAEALEGRVDLVHVPDAASALEQLEAVLTPGDAVLVKGSNGVGLSKVVAALSERAHA